MQLRYPLSWLVLACALAVSALSAYWIDRAEKSDAATRFEQMVNGRIGDLESGVDHFEVYLRGIGGLFATAPRVTPQEWARYVSSLEVRLRRDSFVSVGYAPVVSAGETAAFLDAVRRQQPGFALRAASGNDGRMLPVQFIEKLRPEAALLAAGDDLLATPAFAAAILDAEKSGKPVVSGTAEFGSPAGGVAMVAMMVLPLHASGQLTGTAWLMFRIDEVARALARGDPAGMRLRITDESAGGAEIFRTGATGPAAYRSVRSLDFGGRRWTLRFESTPELASQIGGGLARTVAIFGALASFLLFVLVRVLTGTRRRAEEIATRTTRALSDQMKLIEDLIELNPSPIFRKDAQGRFILFNRAWERLTGRAREDWIGKTSHEVLNPEIAERDAAQERELLAHPDHVERLETTISTADGAPCHVIISKSAVRLADGSAAGIIGTITDVSETRRLAEQNERQREQLALVNQSAQAGVWDVEWPQGTAYFSPRYFEMLGYHETLEGGLPGARSELVHPDDRARVEAAREAHFNGQQPYFDCEYRLRRADGSYLWVNGRGLASLDGAGKPVRYTGSIIDITQRRLAQLEIEHQREQLELVIESVQAGVWDEDLIEGRTYFSRRYCEILGYAREADLFSQGMDEMRYHPEDRGAVMAAREVAVREGAPLDLEFRMRHCDGHHVWVNARAKASYDASGFAVRFTGAIIDISNRKEAEFALRDANLRAIEAARVKSTFLATMSHEIRTPLNGVIGSAGLLQDTRLDAEQQDYVETIRLSGVQLLTLIDDILDYSKIESGHMELEDLPFDVATVIEDAFDLAAERARAKRLELLYDIRADVPSRIHGDITRVRQVLINLVGNAVKFTEHGEVCITCSLAEGDPSRDDGFTLRFDVRDTGIGVPADKIARLFTPFSQVDASTTRKYGGTGLGLAISQRLVGLMGGEIGVTSEPGKGSTFSFTLRTRRADEDAAHKRRMGEIGSIAGKRVLIVDDYESNRRILAAQCANWGLWTVETESVAAALEALAAAREADTPFNAVITDMLMPNQDGVDLARQVDEYRRRYKLRLPVLILSSAPRAEAFAGREVPERWFDAYLLKPARQAQLFNALLDALAPERPFHLTGPESVARPGAMRSHPGRLRILLAEDNEINQKIALRMLERMGRTATLVDNGLRAYELALTGEFDCVLMDVQMPELDGLEATRRIAVAMTAERMPYIIAMTANAMAGDREICAAAGMHDYISKPVQMQAFSDALMRAQNFLMRRAAEQPVVPGGESAAHAGREAGPQGSSGAGDAGGPGIDQAQIDELLGLDDTGAVLADFIQMYTTQAPQRIAEMRRLLSEGDLKRLSQIAHSLKGASGNLGAGAVAEVAQRIEAAGQGAQGEGIDAMLDEIGLRYAEAEALLKALPAAPAASV